MRTQSDPMILHIADPHTYDAAVASGSGIYKPTSFDTEGFIHCSDMSQLASTLHRHFGAADRLLLLAIDSSAEQEHLRYEDLYKRGQEYPHLYRPLPLSSVLGTYVLERKGGMFSIPFEWMRSFG